MSIYSVLLGITTFFSTLGGGLAAVKLRKKFGILAAFAAGVLIAVPLFDLLPESINLASQIKLPVEIIMYMVALGFIFLFVLERYISVHRICSGRKCRNIRHPKAGLYGASELSIHSFIDGFSIGLAFQLNIHTGIIVAMAVIAHDFSDGINTVTVMLNAGNTLKSSIKMLLLDAIAPLFGVILALFLKLPTIYLALFLPFFAGGFLYLGSSDLLPKAHEKNPPLISLLVTLSGFLLIFIVTYFLRI